MINFPRVEIEWVDHAGDSNDWHSIEEAKEWMLSPYKHLGYLLKEHQDRYVIAFGVANEERDQCVGLMIIAKAQTVKVTYLEDTRDTPTE